MATDTSADWVSVSEATGILGRSERTVRRMYEDGRLPVKRDGYRVLVDVSAYRSPKGDIIDTADLPARVTALQAEVKTLRDLVDRQDREIEFLRAALAQAMRLKTPAVEQPGGRRSWWPPWGGSD